MSRGMRVYILQTQESEFEFPTSTKKARHGFTDDAELQHQGVKEGGYQELAAQPACLKQAAF